MANSKEKSKKSEGYSQREFSEALRKMSERYGIKVIQNTGPQEPADKFEVRMIPKKKEE